MIYIYFFLYCFLKDCIKFILFIAWVSHMLYNNNKKEDTYTTIHNKEK